MKSEGSLPCSQESATGPTGHMNPDHNFAPYFPNVYSNIIFPSTPRSSEWYLPYRFFNKNFYSALNLSEIRWVVLELKCVNGRQI